MLEPENVQESPQNQLFEQFTISRFLRTANGEGLRSDSIKEICHPKPVDLRFEAVTQLDLSL